MLKQTLTSIAAGALMLSSAAGVFAYGHHSNGGNDIRDSYNTTTKTINKTVTVQKVGVDNFAIVHNDVNTTTNTGLNFMMVPGGDTSTGNATADDASKGGTNNVTGGSATGGNTAGSIKTGNAGASSTVTSVVNTTFVHF